MAGSAHTDSPQGRTIDLDFVVVGGGILGTAVAALASQADYRVLVLRLNDSGIPRADTLRNQGWLQSGLLYRLEDFSDEAQYQNVAGTTYFGGREMLRACKMECPPQRGMLRVVKTKHIAETEHKARLLRLQPSEFRRLENNEALERLGEMYESESVYYTLPDSPFDEAGVLQYLRSVATDGGAEFIQLAGPVSLEPARHATRIRWGQTILESPVTLVAAGAGSFPLMEQVGHSLSGVLRRTPLLVHSGTCGIGVPLLVDRDRGFSVVRHVGNSTPSGAVVIGTRAHDQPVAFAPVDSRRIRREEVASFERYLHPGLAGYVRTGRFTAGYEVIPRSPSIPTFVEPWVEDCGSIVFASPGRATLGLKGAEKALAAIIGKISARNRKPFQYIPAAHTSPWNAHIFMHFADRYEFNDFNEAEN